MGEPPSAGATVDGRYLLEALLGTGGYGEVWRAHDVRLPGRSVAIKFLKAEHGEQPHVVARFDAEADALALLHHPHVIGASDRGEWAGRRYLVTELIDGISLAQWIDARRAADVIPDLVQVRRLFDQVCAGMEAAHTVRVPGPIVHRDLKPENVLLEELPDGQLAAKVVDFGIAQFGGRRHTNTGTMLGTPTYMAPEQAMGRSAAVGPASDVFALAVMLVEMMTYAAAPNEEQSWWGVALEHGEDIPALLAALRTDVPPGVWRVVARAMRSRPGDRYGDAGALRRALRDAWDAPGSSEDTGPARAASASGAHRALETTTADDGAARTIPAPAPGASSPAPRPRPRGEREKTPIAVAVHTPAVPALVLARSQPRAVVLAVVAASALLSVAFVLAVSRTGGAPVPADARRPAAATPPAPAPVAAVIPSNVPVGAAAARDAAIVEPAELPRPLATNPELDAFLRAWHHGLFDQRPPALPEAQYIVHPRFRAGGPLTTARHIRDYWASFRARGGSFTVDWARSTWREEYAPEEHVRNQCGRIAGAVGPFYLARVWAAEYAPDRPNVAPCAWIRGVYLLRMRRVEGQLRICYESWSTREGLCASCPRAPACSGDGGGGGA